MCHKNQGNNAGGLFRQPHFFYGHNASREVAVQYARIYATIETALIPILPT